MINALNPLNELSDIYHGSISEADNSPEAVKGRVMQYVRAIRYRARKENETLSKAYNEFMGGQSGVSGTEKQMVKERLGLTGGATAVGEEVENLDELSKRTLGNYVKDASSDAAMTSMTHGNKPLAKDASKREKKILNRLSGIRKATDKLSKEEVEHVDEKISASGYARAKKYREDQARAKDKKEQEYYANKAKTHKWDGEKWNKKEKVSEENVDEGIGDMAIKAIEKTKPPYISKRSEMMRKIKLNQLKDYLKKQDDKKKKAASKD